jgi:hypothetical protein
MNIDDNDNLIKKNIFVEKITFNDKQIEYLLINQHNKCANYPKSGIIQNNDFEIYYCPLWKLNNGFFDDAGYNNKYIIDYSRPINNFVLLCHSCSSVKKKYIEFYNKHTLNNNNKIPYCGTTNNIINNFESMDIV